MRDSRLSALLIDCQADSLDVAVAFWSEALHLQAEPETRPDGRYWTLRGGDLEVLLQRVEWPSSYHVDIEADDVDAEADRLEALGAVRKRKQQDWWVMRAPTGHDFCVVPRAA